MKNFTIQISVIFLIVGIGYTVTSIFGNPFPIGVMTGALCIKIITRWDL